MEEILARDGHLFILSLFYFIVSVGPLHIIAVVLQRPAVFSPLFLQVDYTYLNKRLMGPLLFGMTKPQQVALIGCYY